MALGGGQYLNVYIFLVACYALIKAVASYSKNRDTKTMVILAAVIVFFSQQFMELIGFRLLKSINLPVILNLIPLLVFIMYDRIETKRKEAEAGKEKIKQVFKHYVNPYVVDKLLEEKELKLDGVRQEVSVLFIDIRGFTSLSEKLSAEEVVKLLNKYFDLVTNAVFKYNGTVDKFIGDAVMAIFNAPLKQVKHTELAVSSAIEIFKELEKLNKALRKEKLEINAGVGINVGEAIVGNVGSQQFMDYTVIGDTVNVASRLQGQATKGKIIVSEALKKRLSSEFKTKKVGDVTVKGKEKPITIYEVLY